MFQQGRTKRELSFIPKRILIMKGMGMKDERGAHAHHKTHQVLVAINGGCTVDIEDAQGKKSITLSRPDEGVYLYPYVWHVMRVFKPKTVLMMITDRHYHEKDYIRSYDEFKRIIGKKHA